MINILIKSLEIDIAYAVNSYIYILRKMPIFKDLFTDDVYNSKIIKKIVGFFGIIISISRAIFLKFIYFFVIYFITYKLFPNDMVKAFFHIYFILTILGMFINNKLLNTSKKKYFSIVLFNMNANEFFRMNIFWNLLTSTILNSIIIYIFVDKLLISPTIFYTIIFIILSLNVRLIGETLNILYFKKYKYIWYTNSSLYFPILIVLLGLCFLPYINIFVPIKIIELTTLITIPLAAASIIYLLNIKNYRQMYKRLVEMTDVMNEKNEKDYLKQAMVEVKEKDKKIDTSILEKKSGYDLFNTIFFERHKEILLRSAKKYAIIALIVYCILGYLMINYSNYNKSIAELLHIKLSIFIMIMFFINRGAIITQAMFFNCDHAMLRFNFYREPQVILELFKKRLTTVVKVNLIPAIIIGIGNIILLNISTNNYSLLTYITTFLFIICLSIFFSVHYLVIYYLLQPFDKDMQVKKASYSFVTLITYIITYMLTKLVLTSEILSILGIVFVLLYIVISLRIVYKVSPRTFKLN